MHVPILYEDNHLLIVEKPVNMPTQEDASGDEDLLNHLKNMIKIRDEKPGNVYLALVHRLDRPVGGVMVFAKTSKAASRLSDQIRRRALRRRYYAVVRGKPTAPMSELVDYLYKDRRRNFVTVVPEGDQRGKKAVLDYRVVDSADGLSLLDVELHTGRSHQIRVQLAHMGTSIAGDQKYGGPDDEPGQQIALWAHYLELEHPTKREPVIVECQPPQNYPWLLFSDD